MKGVRKGEGSTQGSVCVKVGGEVGQPIVGSDPERHSAASRTARGTEGAE